MSKVSVIIPTMKGREAMLKKLLSTIPDKYEKLAVDDPNLLLAAKRNYGATRSGGEYFLFVDDDNYLESGAIEAALETCSRPGVGVVGFVACYDDKPNVVADGGSKRNYTTGFTTGVNTNAFWLGMSKKPYEVDEVANAFMMHCETFFELHGFDEKNFPIDLDEADFCKRAKNRGFRIIMCPSAKCYHKSQTYSHIPNFRRPMNAYFMGRNRVLYQRKHNRKLQFAAYLAFFLPLFVSFYVLSLFYRRKPAMCLHFLKGVFDGIFGRQKNKYQ